jgi:hypothetical protein
MDLVTALAVVIGIMGAIATWIAVSWGGAWLLIWAIFIGWGSFYHCGGKEAGLKNSIVANIWGAVCAAVALIVTLLLAGGLGVPLAAAICVGVTVAIMILGAKVPALGAIPAAVYGYASTAGLFLTEVFGETGGPYGDASNGAVVQCAIAIIISIVIGNILGYISEKIAGSLVKS